MNPFTDGYTLKYSEYENVNNIEDIKHPIIRESLKLGFKKKSRNNNLS